MDAAVNVYECTNWAFLMREGLDRSRMTGSRRRLLLQIVDCDVHGIEAAWRTRRESIHVLYEHFCADDVWETLGYSRKAGGRVVRESRVANVLRRSMFQRLVPSIRDLGLLSAAVARQLDQLGMLEYAALPALEEEP